MDNNTSAENIGLPGTLPLDEDALINPHDPLSYDTHVNYIEYGFYQSRVNKGEESALKLNINKLYHRFREEVEKDEEKQKKLKMPLRIKLEELKTRNLLIDAKVKEIKESRMPPLSLKIEAAEKRIADIRMNPSLANTEEINMVSWIMGWVVFGFLTLYLWIFYCSASYSAFFRQIEEIPGAVTQAIFYPKAMEMALQDGFPEFLLITTMPFIFLGLGYLIYKYEEKEGTLFNKISIILIGITLVLDFLLAFEVTKKIFELNELNKGESIGESYHLGMAVTDSNFYVIIASGFVVYFIWGLVLSFVMEGYRKRNKVKVAVDAEKLGIQQLEEQLGLLRSDIDNFRGEADVNMQSIAKIEESLSGTLVNTKDFERRMYEFASGWVEWITQRHYPREKVSSAQLIAAEFIRDLNNQPEPLQHES